MTAAAVPLALMLTFLPVRSLQRGDPGPGDDADLLGEHHVM